MKTNDNNRQIQSGKSIKGSAIYGEDGTYIFTPYAESKPENANWLPLATVENGKLECSKKKVRMVLTMDRADLPLVTQTFIRAFGQLVGKTSDKRVQKMYKAAASQRPADVQPETHPNAPCEEEEPIPMFP